MAENTTQKNEEFLKELAILVYGMNIQQLAEEITRIVNEEAQQNEYANE
ncbi:MAG: hypothetical protein E6590_16820 [Clostridiales bacterium]|uniref:Uncharacterized protein n=1 Tax=Zhenhengia yiwuensis TaxID=2763666 RepID=A0A926IF48_9FIRM|nr:hypothetical protein [Zhenhengia yiwuensis]MBC8581362.1 hypothetical protein [Zhenhengia yiwuensis]MDU6361596.1 hypothetical protein [Clostridiales bacterium]